MNRGHNLLLSTFLGISFFITSGAENQKATDVVVSQSTSQYIENIVLTRHNKNRYLTDDAIKSKIPFQAGTTLDVTKTSRLIHNLYDINAPYGFFEQIYVMQENLAENRINLHVVTYEKPELEEIIILGNKQLSDETINEKLALGDIQALNEVDIQRIEKAIRKAYQEKNFQYVQIMHEVYKKGNRVSVIFVIDEGVKSFVKKVNFVGNKAVRSKDLRSIIFTREDWLFGFMNQAGTYNPEFFEADKYFIENYYKARGYVTAKVLNIDVQVDDCKQYEITYTINEGDCYTVGEVRAPGNDIVPENILMLNVTLKKGDVYSETALRDSIDKLRRIWGIYGYIFADIEPIVVPNPITRTIDITLNSELGDKIYVNRINIKGNKKTRDNVIRRRLTFAEGNLLTSSDMDASKAKVENLGYFDPREGVNWKINRIDDHTADLDLQLKEVNTGRANFQAGFGGSDFNIFSAARSFKLGGSVSDINLLGTGIIFRAGGSWSKEEWSAALNIANPWLFERPVLGEVDVHVTRSDYSEELHDVNSFTQQLVGGFFGMGFTLGKTIFKDSAISARVGGERITNTSQPMVIDTNLNTATLQNILNLSFQDGTFGYISAGIAQDFRNHSLHPSGGYQWSINGKIGASGKHDITLANKTTSTLDGYGFAKLDLDGTWYTPLIGINSLVFGLHGHVGIIGTLKDKDVPYRELYHIGGPASVRGFLYGQIGPTFLNNSIGAKKAFWLNAEVVFPITQDFNMKGSLFYDGGAGWDAAYKKVIPDDQLKLLQGNNFNFRHAIGAGFRMLSPQPISIYVGFKLDKQKNENAVEVHFNANRDF